MLLRHTMNVTLILVLNCVLRSHYDNYDDKRAMQQHKQATNHNTERRGELGGDSLDRGFAPIYIYMYVYSYIYIYT